MQGVLKLCCAAVPCRFCYQLRILEVILPDDVRNPLKCASEASAHGRIQKEIVRCDARLEENIGDAWWPASWRCPSAFAPAWHGLSFSRVSYSKDVGGEGMSSTLWRRLAGSNPGSSIWCARHHELPGGHLHLHLER